MKIVTNRWKKAYRGIRYMKNACVSVASVPRDNYPNCAPQGALQVPRLRRINTPFVHCHCQGEEEL